jgi:fermentation-respiration switch protein FrsA (DUF1100 family)
MARATARRRRPITAREKAEPTAATHSLTRRILTRLVVVVGACTLVPVLLLYLFQGAFLYATGSEVLPIATVLPGGTEVRYRTDDGVELLGWFLPSKQPTPSCGAAPAALLFHGQGGNRSWEYPLANALAAHGISVFIAEYRGFGGTEGSPSEDGITLDARAALAALQAQPGVAPDRIVYIGYSLGTGVAARLAATAPPKGLVLLAPYTSLPDIAWERMPLLPYHLLMHDQYDTLSRIGAVDVPLVVVISSTDEVVPPEQSRRVYEAARHPEMFVPLDGLSHAEVEGRAGDLAIAQIAGFTTNHAGCAPPP